MSQRAAPKANPAAARLRQEEATAGNVASPKGISKKTPSSNPKNDGGLQKTRRRLSVVSDNKLVEGMSGMSTAEEAELLEGTSLVVASYAGVSKKGYAPYNPRKKNQVYNFRVAYIFGIRHVITFANYWIIE